MRPINFTYLLSFLSLETARHYWRRVQAARSPGRRWSTTAQLFLFKGASLKTDGCFIFCICSATFEQKQWASFHTRPMKTALSRCHATSRSICNWRPIRSSTTSMSAARHPPLMFPQMFTTSVSPWCQYTGQSTSEPFCYILPWLNDQFVFIYNSGS